MDKRIYLCLAHMSGKEMGFIQEAFDTNWVVPLGPNVNAFEQGLERFVGQDKKVVALSAGTAAVHLALLACGVGQGDEVIVQSFTFCASSHPVTYLGATPVFVDHGPGSSGAGYQGAYRQDRPEAQSDCSGGFVWDALQDRPNHVGGR